MGENSGITREYGATEAVPPEGRPLGFLDMVTTWIGANANNGTWYVGGVVAGAAFSGAFLVTVVANPIAYLVMALIGFMGFRCGISTMALTRLTFGARGSAIPSILNSAQFIGWTAVNTFIAAISISFLLKDIFLWPSYGEPGGQRTMLLGIALMSILHFISVLTGHRSVKICERIGVALILVLGLWETLAVFRHVSFEEIMRWRPPAEKVMPLGKAMDAMAAFSLGWVPAIAEFTRYSRTKAAATIAPMIGANVALFWFAFVGIIGAISTAITSGVYDPNNSDPSTIVSRLGLGVIAFLVIIITSTTANAVNLMAAGISLTNIAGRMMPLRAIWAVTIISAAVTVIPLYLTSFLSAFIIFLDYIGLLFGPLFAVMIVDYFIIREGHRGKATALEATATHEDLAIPCWAAGLAIYFLIRTIPAVSSFTGAIYPTMALTGILYFLVGKTRKKRGTFHE
ncbi:MAG: cytosine permease [Candidatus Eremiobacteraeota bacterium]|nr:cytosine permease [Candidatus Eremiobacteraeota bacterium]